MRVRGRSNSAVKLDVYYRVVYQTILRHQHPVTGLLPADDKGHHHAWIRDNLYCIMSVWALSLAYKKSADFDEDKAKAQELELATVKCMRGLLSAMIRQRHKVERFKDNNSALDAIHAKFDCRSGAPVVGDNEWGHLQIDAISLFLLTLAQMTASGLQIIFSLDEVSFVQNLVFYIESAYCIPDYGIWERGDKSNTGITELNSSSIGMAIAALEAVNELDLFGIRGGSPSVIHVNSDELQKCKAVLQSMLPRESLSKETDAALLTVVGFPAFACEDPYLLQKTRQEVISKLCGKYGCKRFLRDGYKNPKEDSSRLHYEPWELRVFENIECQWPLFFCFLIIDGCFEKDDDAVEKYSQALEEVMVRSKSGLRLIPELYAVPRDKVEQEQACPGSQPLEVAGRVPFMWAQSLYIFGRLLKESLVALGEIDPMNRRLGIQTKPEVIVQVVVLAKNKHIQELLNSHNISLKTLKDVQSVEVHPARVLSYLYAVLGKNEKLGLSGRKIRDVGILTTSKLYKIQDRIFAFTPQRFDFSRNYMDCDTSLMMTTLEYGLNYLSTCWSAMGRPIITLIMGDNMLDNGKVPLSMLSALRKLKGGYINGTRVIMGSYEQFLSTSCVTHMSFLNEIETGRPDSLQPEVQTYLSEQLGRPLSSTFTLLGTKFHPPPSGGTIKRYPSDKDGHSCHGHLKKKRHSMRGSIRKCRSKPNIQTDDDETGMTRSRAESGESTGATGSSNRDRLQRLDSILNENDDSEIFTFCPSAEERERLMNLSPYGHMEVGQLVTMLIDARNIEEQVDILHFLVVTYGVDYTIHVKQLGKDVGVKDLLNTLYETACAKKSWSIIRHSAGLLGKKVEDLSKTITDLLVRQKQVTVGLPPDHEVILNPGQLKSNELRRIIHSAYGGDESMAMLTQELFVYLTMFIQTEPELFHGMLRVRVGLIIQVMTQEVARSLNLKDDDDATDELLNLSPFEMRNLLHHIMSGQEFGMQAGQSGFSVVTANTAVNKERRLNLLQGKEFQKAYNTIRKASKIFSQPIVDLMSQEQITSVQEEDETNLDGDDSDDNDSQGLWLRRRRLDGALNRVPMGFYAKIWKILETCQAIVIQGKVLGTQLTQEMTSGEMKFALRVESVLNTVSEPEFRQLLVEVLILLSLAVENRVVPFLDDVIHVAKIVTEANKIFLKDQAEVGGDATTCCARPDAENNNHHNNNVRPGRRGGSVRPNGCGSQGICKYFYDSAPSGTYGTMSYMVRAMAVTLEKVPKEGDIECVSM